MAGLPLFAVTSPLSTILAGLLLVAAVFLILKSRYFRHRQSNHALPPGPPAEPILGHLRIIPTFSPEYAYQQWSQEYNSDVLLFKVLGQPVVVLNSVQAAIDLLDKRGANYSDRPRFVLFEVMGWQKTLTFLRWGPAFRLHRSILQKNFQKSNIARYRPIQVRETAVMLASLIRNTNKWEDAIRRFATSVILEIGFGIQITGDDDPFLQVAKDASYALSHGGAPAGTPVDFFPILRWFPSWCHDRSLKFAAAWRWAIVNLYNKPYDEVIRSGSRTTSLVQAMLEQRRNQMEEDGEAELDAEDIKGAAGAVFAAGQDTTSASIIVFVLNMVLHPEVQKKAQRELEDVVGRARLPDFSDRPSLRYIDYIVQETLRWCPVSPIGVPHRSLADDTYKGYLIPAGSFVYANARAMTHDVRIYEEPDDFNPDRYTPVTEGGRGEPFPNGQFGFGRRKCVGQHLAEANLWIVVASMLSTMDIRRAVDETGAEITPNVELTAGLTSHPKSFPCRIVARDKEASELVHKRNDELRLT